MLHGETAHNVEVEFEKRRTGTVGEGDRVGSGWLSVKFWRAGAVCTYLQ